MHSGGIADKIGNRYEARWLTHQLLGLLDGSVRSITIEALGDKEQGFEFSLERPGGTEWHQCKRQTAAGTWTIPNLASAGVLAAFARKTAETGARCLFISSDPSSQLKLLQDKLPATHTLEGFERSLSDKETQHWSVLKDRLKCDGSDALRFLAFTEFRTLSEADLTDIVRARFSYWFKGNPDTISALFRTWIEDECNFNRPLTYDDLVAFIDGAGLKSKQYEFDRALPGRIRDATSSYSLSYPPVGAGLFRIERPMVREVLAALSARARVVLLTGAAGIGKSAILGELIDELRAAGTLHLAFRVDQTGAVASLADLGSQIVGTADNPVVILEQLASGRRAVLIIDQADAVSEASGRIAELRRVVLDLVRKAAQYPRVQLIFSCRTFDLENDHAFRDIAETTGNVRIDVKPFKQSEVEPVLTRLGILVDAANTRLMALLCLPIGLSLAATLSHSGIADLRTVEHLSELYGRLLAIRDQEIQRELRPGWSVFAPLTALAAEMSERQELVAAVSALDSFGGAIDILQRAGLIVVRGRRIGFLHESLFDYLHARAFVQQRRALLNFLLGNEQTLFRRTQTRQILAFERELERSRYLNDLEAILTDKRVRSHVRETVVRWLATIPDPTFAEWELVARYAARDGLPMKSGNVIYARKPWFDLLRGQGVIDLWLTSDGDDLQWALHYLQSVATLAPTEVAQLFNAFLERRPRCIRAVFAALRRINPNADAGPLADCLIAALERSVPEDWEADHAAWDEYYGSWIQTAPREAARIFGAQFRCWFRLNPEGHPFKRRYENGGTAMYWLTELAKAAPLPFLEHLLPFLRLAMERCGAGDQCSAEDSIWHWRRWDRTDVRSVELLDVVRAALADVARKEPDAAAHLLRAIEPDQFIISLHLLLETVPANAAALHPLLLEQIDNPGLFKAGWYRADGYSAGNAIASTMPYLSPADRARCEAVVLALRPEIESASRALARTAVTDAEGAEGGEASPPHKPPLGQYPTWCLNVSGKREWSVLLQIGADQLLPPARRRLAELARKFAGQKPEEPDGIRGGMVRSPIASERTKFMNDAAWLDAINKFSKPGGHRSWDADGLRGGARELSSELKERAKEQPKRFLAFLARLPEGAYKDFAWGIVAGITETKPSADTVEQVLAIVAANPPARPDDRTLVWLIRACVEPIGPLAEATLLTICLSSDDSTGIGNISRPDEEREADWKLALNRGGELGAKAINSARGSALEYLGGMCWRSREAFERYRPTIDRVVGASAAPHIHAALDGLLLSALKHQGRGGIDWVSRTARACPDALFTRDGQQAIDWVGDLDTRSFTDLLRVYIPTTDPQAQAFGALAAFQRCLNDPEWIPFAEQLIEASAEYRAAAAAVAAANFQSARFGTICTEWLIRFFDDDAKIVRREASDCFRRMKAENIAEHVRLFEVYVASRYFETERSYFLHRLEHAPVAMDDLVLRLLEEAVQLSETPDRERRAYELREVCELVLRLYASNVDNPARRTRSLDIIDRLVERGLMEMHKLEAA